MTGRSGQAIDRAVRPAFLSLPAWDFTLGPDVAGVCADAGYAPDPDQAVLLDATFAYVRVRGVSPRVAAGEVASVACRQNLKTGWMKQTAIGDLFVVGVPLLVWSAHEFAAVAEAHRDLEILIEGSDVLRRRVKSITHGTRPAIELLPDPDSEWTAWGARAIFRTRTKGGGRALAAPRVMLDEGMFLRATHMGALRPVLSAQSDPQLRYGSSACHPDSDVLHELVKRGRAGTDPRLAYMEHCAPPVEEICDQGSECRHEVGAAGCGYDKPEFWRCGNPSTARTRANGTGVTLATIADERRSMPPAEFGRERMGHHDIPVTVGNLAFPADRWEVCKADPEDPASSIVSAPQFALDVSPRSDWAAIVAAGFRADGSSAVEVTTSDGGHVVDHRPGTDWVLGRLVDLASRWSSMRVSIASGSQAEAMRPDIEALGIEVDVVPSGEVAAGCGLALARITARKVRHIGQPQLDWAVGSAQRRDIGDNTWALARRKSGRDITPAYGMVLALWRLVGGTPMVSVHGADLELCDSCGLNLHEDPEGEHGYLCGDCRPKEETE